MTDYSKATMCFQPPSEGNHITCVFENPTWREKICGYPVAGITGSNLCLLFHILRCMDSKFIEKFRGQLFRCRVCIVNGSQAVYDSSDERADGDYLKDVCNNSKLIKEALQINDVERLVLCFGDRAELAVKKVMPACRFTKVYHLSGHALNGICQYDAMAKKYGLPEVMRGAMPLILIAEYIVNHYEADGFMEFSEFVKPFRSNGDGDFLKGTKRHNLDMVRLASVQCFREYQCRKEGVSIH